MSATSFYTVVAQSYFFQHPTAFLLTRWEPLGQPLISALCLIVPSKSVMYPVSGRLRTSSFFLSFLFVLIFTFVVVLISVRDQFAGEQRTAESHSTLPRDRSILQSISNSSAVHLLASSPAHFLSLVV